MDCIYCKKKFKKSLFRKREHVIPQSFGKFKKNFTLIDTVCDECNEYFSRELELRLGRDTIDGLSRLNFLPKVKERYKSLGKKSRIKIRIDQGQWKGLFGYLEYRKNDNEIRISPLPQIGLFSLEKNDYVYFQTDEPYRIKIDIKGYDVSGHMIKFIEIPDRSVKKFIKKYKIDISSDNNFTYKSDDEVDCVVQEIFDEQYKRSIYKICINYFAFIHPEIINNSTFNKVKDYVRNGNNSNTFNNLIVKTSEAILEDEKNGKGKRVGHIITVSTNKENNSLLFRFSLFNTFSYLLVIPEVPASIINNIYKEGYIFNLYNMEILKLGSN